MQRRKKGKRKRKHIIGWSKVLTKDEQQMLMGYLSARTTDSKTKVLYLMCDILINTGLRVSELCNLRIKDTPYVLKRNVIEVYLGKNNKDRTIPISSRLTRAIIKYVNEARPGTLPRFVARDDVKKYVFYNEKHKQFKRHAVLWAISSTAVRAGISKPVTPHKLRHTFATNTLLKGIDLQTVSRLMGHLSVVTTNKYVDIVNEMDADLGERIDQVFERTLW